MGKRKNEFDSAGFGRRRQTLQIDNTRRREEPAPWEIEDEADGACQLVVSAAAGHVWQEVPDPASGESYYWNVNTGETRWDRPAESTILPSASLPRQGSDNSSASGAKTDDSKTESAKSAPATSSAAGGSAALTAFDYGSDSDDSEVPPSARAASAANAARATAGACATANGAAGDVDAEDQALLELEALAAESSEDKAWLKENGGDVDDDAAGPRAAAARGPQPTAGTRPQAVGPGKIGAGMEGVDSAMEDGVGGAEQQEGGGGGAQGVLDEDRKPLVFAMPKAKAKGGVCVDLEAGKQALAGLRPTKDSEVDDFLAQLDQSSPLAVAAPPPSAIPTPLSIAAKAAEAEKGEGGSVGVEGGGVKAGCGRDALPSAPVSVSDSASASAPASTHAGAVRGDERVEEQVVIEMQGGQRCGDGDGAGTRAGDGGGPVGPTMADKSDRGTEVAEGGKGDSEAKDDAEMAAVDTQLIGRVCFEVLTLKRQGDEVIAALKSAIAQEEAEAVGRRDVLLTLLGGMLSWSGLVADLGILVSDHMTSAFADSVDKMLPKLGLRLSKCREALEAQDAQRQASTREALPDGWHRVTASHDATISLYYRFDPDSTDPLVSVQTTPPPHTRHISYPSYACHQDQEGNGNGEEGQERKEGECRQERGEMLPEYEAAHVATMAALPACSGAVCDKTMLMYLRPETDCNVAYMLQVFHRCVSYLTQIRIIGGGFVSVAFDSDLTCQTARDQCIVERRGQLRAYPAMKDWTVLSAGDGESGGIYARLAASADQVERYPLHFTQQACKDPPAKSAAPFVDPFAEVTEVEEEDEGQYVPDVGSGGDGLQRGSASMSKNSINHNKVLVSKAKVPKLKASFSKQVQKWKQKQEEMMPEEEEEKPMTLEQLEQEKRRRAEAWYEDQISSGAMSANPNLMPVGYKAQTNEGFAMPAPKQGAKNEANVTETKKVAGPGGRQRLAAKF